MGSKFKIILIFCFVGLALENYGQMIEGNYPFQLKDSLIFNKTDNLLQIDLNQKPNNFISTSEQYYLNGLEIDKDKADFYSKQIDILHRKANNRDFIAGISNYSSDTIFIPIQDNSVIAIIEAKDKNGTWKPIQFWPISRCGNSYYSESILPGQTLYFTVKKNYGDLTINLRLKLHGTDTIYVSDDFPGTIDESLFTIKPNIEKDYKHILCDSIFYLQKPLFGNLNYDKFEIDIEEE
jgi:hypothetical protein